MIPVETDITQIDTLPGDETEFSIGDARWVMRSMSDLYSNRELAVVREYSTNAYDAAYERALLEGIDTPAVEVTLPSMMNPYFKIRDYGFGMSTDVLREIYTKFGESTKRVSNDFNGMLGFGCKSAMAYTNTFNVVSIHNGIKTVAVITRRPDWSIVLKVVDISATTEPSGTEVVIPVHNWDEFTQKANDFYKFWLPGTVKVNGAFPEHAVGEKITDGLYYSQNWNRSYVVMGNVPYRIENPDALFWGTKVKPINFVAYVDNGDVEFTPSREDLKYTQRTKDTLKKVILDFAAKIVAQAQSEVDGAKSHPEAFAAWKKWTDVLGRDMFADLEFKGVKFRSDFAITGSRYQTRGGPYSTYSIRNWNVESMPSTMVVTEFDINLSSSAKSKAKEYAKLQGWTNLSNILFTSEAAKDIDCVWITKDRFVGWETLKEALPKKPRRTGVQATGPRRIKGTFDYFTAEKNVYEEALPTDKNLYFIKVKDVKGYGNIRTIIAAVDPKACVVILSVNRINKFTRENPSVKEFIPFAKSKVVLDGSKLLSDDAKTVMGFDYDTRQWLKNLNLTRVNDPELHRLSGLLQNEDALLKSYRDNITLASCLGMRYNLRDYRAGRTDIASNYPLLNNLSGRGLIHDHVYIYLNAAYAAKEGK